MINKKIILVTGNTCWWKEKKFRYESAQELNKYRSEGWRLRKKVVINNNTKSIDSRKFHKYILFKIKI